MRELKKLLSDLIAIPSVNPMGFDRSGQEYLEAHLAEYVARFLRKMRVDVEVREVFPQRPNVVGYVDAHAKETILLEAHMDTIPVDNMTIEPFKPVIKAGKVFGRGSCDTKASLAAILLAVKQLLNSRKRLSRNVIIAAVCDEEYGLNGTRAILKDGRKMHYAIVGEPTGLEIVNEHKGVMRWRMTVHGKSAHSAYPQDGINAIFHAGILLNRLNQHAQDLLSGRRHPTLGTPTLSVGTIVGGQSVNTIPNECTIEIDRRTLPRETPASVLARVRRLIPRSIHCIISKPHLVVPGLDGEENEELVRILRDAIRGCNLAPVLRSARYVTDASLYAAKGIPAVVFGPGRIEQAHAEVEFVRLREVERAVEVYKKLLTSSSDR
jgi:acetylornithine deacetylase/succinyl-diaminopimelate desuccinylase family protein